MVRGAKTIVECQHCGCAFTARVADRARGWARFCSKSCKAKKQEQRTGQYASYMNRSEYQSERDVMDCAYPFGSLAEHDCNKD